MIKTQLKRLSVMWFILSVAVAALFTGLMLSYAKVTELEGIAASEGIPVYYVSADAIESYVGQCANGFYDIDFNFIAVDGAQKLNARILAHELGHYFAIKYYGDKSEEVAERIGCELLRKSYTENLAASEAVFLIK